MESANVNSTLTPFLDPSAWPTLVSDGHEVSDGELLEIYQKSGSAAAFAAIVRRHAPMVASVIRRMMSHPQDCEDAFQATFLVLVRSATKIRNPKSLAAWLYGVAYRSARKLRAKRSQETRRAMSHPTISSDEPLEHQLHIDDDPLTAIVRQLQLDAMDDELTQLPSHLREPLIEHYMRGATVPEIAKELEMSTSAVEGRLKRGRNILRARLAMRGLSLSISAVACMRFQQEVAHASAAPWSDELLSKITFQGEPGSMPTFDTTLSASEHLSTLIQGEMAMKSIIHTPLIASFGVVGVFVLGYFGLIYANSHGSTQSTFIQTSQTRMASSASDASQVVSAEPSPVPIEFVLAQAGRPTGETGPAGSGSLGGGIGSTGSSGGAGGGPSTGAPGGSSLGGRGSPASPPGGSSAPGASGKGGGGGATTPDAGNGDNQQTPKIIIPWQPNGDDLPSWLRDGEESDSQEIEDGIRSKLNQRVDVEFNAIPLHVFVEFLADKLNVPILIDNRSLEEENVTREEPITISLKEAKVTNILPLVLKPMQLTYKIDREVVTICAVKDGSNIVRYYDLSYVLPDSGLADATAILVEGIVMPDSWQPAGGTASIHLFGSLLVVKNCEAAHLEIEKVLKGISNQQRSNMRPGMSNSRSVFPQGGGMGGGGGMGMGGGGGMF